jgi:hypothetical protein
MVKQSIKETEVSGYPSRLSGDLPTKKLVTDLRLVLIVGGNIGHVWPELRYR